MKGSGGTVSGRWGPSALVLAGAAALLPVAALSAAQVPASAALPPEAEGRFVPPDRAELTRTVRRALPGGAEIVVRRTYQVQFTRDGEGFRVDGSQTGCDVDAPEKLRALADLEKQRIDTGTFPLRLDSGGMIADFHPVASHESAATTRRIAGTMIGRSALGGQDRKAALDFVGTVQAAGNSSIWPRNLFHASAGQTSESRTLALPDGQTGTVTTTIRVREAGPPPGRQVLERTVITGFGGSQRISREEWTLVPHAP